MWVVIQKSETWQSFLLSPSFVSFIIFSFLLFLLNSSLLPPLSHHLPLPSSQSSSPHIAFFSSHFSSSTLSLIPLHIYSAGNLLVSHSLLFCPLSVHSPFSLMSFLQLLFFFFAFLPSSSESCSHLVC